MVKKLEVYKCNVCGSVVETLRDANGTLSCCGQPMRVLKENTVDAAVEKHIPVTTFDENGYTVVKVGEVEHPMTEEHLIEWIEVITKEGTVYRQELDPTRKPEATFKVSGEIDRTREFCNLHGLWSTK